jgi:hypothetical protein
MLLSECQQRFGMRPELRCGPGHGAAGGSRIVAEDFQKNGKKRAK